MGVAKKWVFPIIRLVVFAAIAAALVKLAFFGGLTDAGDHATPTGAVSDPEVQVATQTVHNDVKIDATITADPAVPVRATAGGAVVKVLAKVGQAVDAATPIATVRTEPDLTNLPEGAAPPKPKVTTITAGSAGTLSDLPLLPGQQIAIGDSLAQVAPSTFSVVGSMPPEQQYRLLNRPTEGQVSITGGPQPFTCTGLSISTPLSGAGAGTGGSASGADPSGSSGASGSTTTVRCAVPAGVTVFSGIAAKLVVSGGTAENALVVPVTAVEGSAGGPGTVYVAGSDGKPEKKKVTLGINDGEMVQITEGVKEGDSVLQFIPGSDAETQAAQNGGYGG